MPAPSISAPDLVEGLAIQRDQNGLVTYTVQYECRDLIGATAVEILALALAMAPAYGTPGVVGGTYALDAKAIPWSDHDAYVNVTFGPLLRRQREDGKAYRLRIGTTLQEVMTEWDAANRILPFANREPVKVRYKAGSNTVPAAPTPPAEDPYAQGGQVPWLSPRSTFIYSRINSYDPGAESRQYVGRRNSTPFKGCPAGSVVCLDIEGESTDGENTFDTNYAFGFDDQDYWLQYLRWIDPQTGRPPKLSIVQVSNRNGIQDINVQGDDDLNALGL